MNYRMVFTAFSFSTWASPFLWISCNRLLLWGKEQLMTSSSFQSIQIDLNLEFKLRKSRRSLGWEGQMMWKQNPVRVLKLCKGVWLVNAQPSSANIMISTRSPLRMGNPHSSMPVIYALAKVAFSGSIRYGIAKIFPWRVARCSPWPELESGIRKT